MCMALSCEAPYHFENQFLLMLPKNHEVIVHTLLPDSPRVRQPYFTIFQNFDGLSYEMSHEHRPFHVCGIQIAVKEMSRCNSVPRNLPRMRRVADDRVEKAETGFKVNRRQLASN